MNEKKDLLSNTNDPYVVRLKHAKYTKQDLMEMDPVCLRALFRERIHHTIEVHLYPIMLGKKELPADLGMQPKTILEVWKQRGLSDDGPDFDWGKKYLAIAEKLHAGEKVALNQTLPSPFSDTEMDVLHKLIWGRRSFRDWIPDKTVPDEMIEKILEAGRAAPTGCNLNIVRFMVVRDPKVARMIWSDIPTPMDQCVLIVICYDTRIYKTTGQDVNVPHNMMLDCAAAADHMCLMAHALGLGAVWLSCTENTARAFKEKCGLPEYINQALHIAVGWASLGTIKSERLPLKEMMLQPPKLD